MQIRCLQGKKAFNWVRTSHVGETEPTQPE